jgi:hypothetical protein
MAYEKYENTYLSKLPYELQDKIEHIINMEKKQTNMAELLQTMSCQVPMDALFINSFPTLYQKKTQEILALLTTDEELDLDNVLDRFELTVYKLINRYYYYPHIGVSKIDIRGTDLDNYFSNVLYQLDNSVKYYTQLLFIECSLSYFEYHELVLYKKLLDKTTDVVNDSNFMI